MMPHVYEQSKALDAEATLLLGMLKKRKKLVPGAKNPREVCVFAYAHVELPTGERGLLIVRAGRYSKKLAHVRRILEEHVGDLTGGKPTKVMIGRMLLLGNRLHFVEVSDAGKGTVTAAQLKAGLKSIAKRFKKAGGLKVGVLSELDEPLPTDALFGDLSERLSGLRAQETSDAEDEGIDMAEDAVVDAVFHDEESFAELRELEDLGVLEREAILLENLLDEQMSQDGATMTRAARSIRLGKGTVADLPEFRVQLEGGTPPDFLGPVGARPTAVPDVDLASEAFGVSKLFKGVVWGRKGKARARKVVSGLEVESLLHEKVSDALYEIQEKNAEYQYNYGLELPEPPTVDPDNANHFAERIRTCSEIVVAEYDIEMHVSTGAWALKDADGEPVPDTDLDARWRYKPDEEEIARRHRETREDRARSWLQLIGTYYNAKVFSDRMTGSGMHDAIQRRFEELPHRLTYMMFQRTPGEVLAALSPKAMGAKGQGDALVESVRNVYEAMACHADAHMLGSLLGGEGPPSAARVATVEEPGAWRSAFGALADDLAQGRVYRLKFDGHSFVLVVRESEVDRYESIAGRGKGACIFNVLTEEGTSNEAPRPRSGLLEGLRELAEGPEGEARDQALQKAFGWGIGALSVPETGDFEVGWWGWELVPSDELAQILQNRVDRQVCAMDVALRFPFRSDKRPFVVLRTESNFLIQSVTEDGALAFDALKPGKGYRFRLEGSRDDGAAPLDVYGKVVGPHPLDADPPYSAWSVQPIQAGPGCARKCDPLDTTTHHTVLRLIQVGFEGFSSMQELMMRTFDVGEVFDHRDGNRYRVTHVEGARASAKLTFEKA